MGLEGKRGEKRKREEDKTGKLFPLDFSFTQFTHQHKIPERVFVSHLRTHHFLSSSFDDANDDDEGEIRQWKKKFTRKRLKPSDNQDQVVKYRQVSFLNS